jgi:hypothetical protein
MRCGFTAVASIAAHGESSEGGNANGLTRVKMKNLDIVSRQINGKLG